jgi:hypothetical protein
LTWGEPGTDDGEFFDPLGVAVTADARIIYVSDGNDRIQKFRSGLVPVEPTTWGRIKARSAEPAAP